MTQQTTTSLPIDRVRFDEGNTFEEYVETMSQNQRRIKQMYDHYSLTADDVKALREAIAKHGGHIYVTVLVEDWCPDVVLNVPILQHMADAVDGFELRLLERPENPDLQAAYLADGIRSIPTVSLFDSEWQEIGRWVERSALANQRRNNWLAEKGIDMQALRQSDDPADKELLQKTFGKIFAVTLGWYRDGLWRETVREVLDIIR